MVKLIDFGLATFTTADKDYLFKRCGTPGFMDPEVINSSQKKPVTYDSRCDVFSVGMIFHFLLTGVLPFGLEKYNEVYKKNCVGIVNLKSGFLKNVDKDAFDLLKKMIAYKKEDRYTAEECQKHDFFKCQINLQEQEKFEEDLNSRVITNNADTHNNNKTKDLTPSVIRFNNRFKLKPRVQDRRTITSLQAADDKFTYQQDKDKFPIVSLTSAQFVNKKNNSFRVIQGSSYQNDLCRTNDTTQQQKQRSASSTVKQNHNSVLYDDKNGLNCMINQGVSVLNSQLIKTPNCDKKILVDDKSESSYFDKGSLIKKQGKSMQISPLQTDETIKAVTTPSFFVIKSKEKSNKRILLKSKLASGKNIAMKDIGEGGNVEGSGISMNDLLKENPFHSKKDDVVSLKVDRSRRSTSKENKVINLRVKLLSKFGNR